MDTGLTSAAAHEKKTIHGRNEITTTSPFSPISLFLSQFLSFINAVLIIAASISFFIHEVTDGIFILAILILNAVFGFFQEYKAEKSLEKLKNFTTPVARVLRDGNEVQIDARDIVPDDVVILLEGDRIPADGKIIESHHIEIDESILTGESLPVVKQHADNLYLGTLVVKGKGRFKVEKIGMETAFGKIAETLSHIKTDKTPLQKNLSQLSKTISAIAVIMACLIIPIGVLQGSPLIPLLLLAGSICIAAIPEGLPAVITIALAIGTNRMARQKTIVRTMPAIETLGAMQIVLVDKTGTLTQNSMRVKELWTFKDEELPRLLQACFLGNTASLITKADGTFDIVGDKTDGALLLYAKNHDLNMEKELHEGKVIDEYVFDTATKTITTVFKKGETTTSFVRGAPEAILDRSKLTDHEKEELKLKYESLAKTGLRVIGFGAKHEKHTEGLDRTHLERNLNFLGFIGIYDPPRPEVKDAISQARRAGIKTIMVTGDNELTALAIGKEIGLIEKDEDVVTGEELKALSDEELIEVMKKTSIYSRAKPEDKYRLATLFKKQGFVVGVTGDGVNDALALKKADVGVAMGESGTDVAKEASDIIITDDNFSTLVKAIEEGRTIYSNILQSILYLITGNLSELSLVFFSTLLGFPTPLLPTQILWVNIVTDGLPALALASDTKNPHVLNVPPRDPKTPILTSKRLKKVFMLGIGLSLILVAVFYITMQYFPLERARTIVFNALIICHIPLIFLIRKQSPLKVNRFLILSILTTLILQIVITSVPSLRSVFHLQ